MTSYPYKNKKVLKFYITMSLYVMLMGTLLCLLCLLCLVPPVSRDALVHHLAVPKIYLNHGGIIELPCMRFSYYPMNLDFLYLGALYFGSDIIPKFIHCSFGVATAGLVFQYLNKRLNRHYAVLGALLLMTVPIVIRLAITVYVDLGLMFFSFAALLAVMKWSDSYQIRYLTIAALCCGLAMGTKYNGLITFLILTLGIPFLVSKKKSQLQIVGFSFYFVLISLIVFSPWMIRNIVWTMNPVYPLCNNLFNSEVPGNCEIRNYAMDDNRLTINKFFYRKIAYQERTIDILLLPLRYFFQGKDHNPRYFDGKLSPYLLILPLFAFLKFQPETAYRKESSIILAFAVAFFVLAFLTGPLRIRYIVPVVPCFAILSVFGVANLLYIIRITAKRILSFSVACIVILVSGYIIIDSGRYIIQTFERVKPIPFICGNIDRDEYISHFRPEYPIFQYINRRLPQESKILFFFLGGRGYYCDRQYIPDQNYNLFKIFEIIREKDLKDISDWFKQRNITHLLFNYNIVQTSIDNDLSDPEKEKFYKFIYNYTINEFNKNGFGLYALK